MNSITVSKPCWGLGDIGGIKHVASGAVVLFEPIALVICI